MEGGPYPCNGTSCAPEKCPYGLPNHTTTQSRCPVVVMDVWEQFHTHTTLLKPLSFVTVFSELYRAMKKLSGKADLDIYSYSVTVSRQCMSVAVILIIQFLAGFPRPGHICMYINSLYMNRFGQSICSNHISFAEQ